MLDDRQDTRRHETSRAHDASVARQLADLDARARAAHLDAASGPGRLDDVLARGAAAGVHEDLDEISLCHTYLLFPRRAGFIRSIGVTAQPPEGARSVEQLKEAAASCRGCELWEHATQTVFGEGREGSKLMLVGEQPGDQEDLQGKPFVGPAGRLLEKALDEAGIDRSRVYVTNAVKHFRWTRRGKRRLHEKPNAVEITSPSTSPMAQPVSQCVVALTARRTQPAQPWAGVAPRATASSIAVTLVSRRGGRRHGPASKAVLRRWRSPLPQAST